MNAKVTTIATLIVTYGNRRCLRGWMFIPARKAATSVNVMSMEVDMMER